MAGPDLIQEVLLKTISPVYNILDLTDLDV